MVDKYWAIRMGMEFGTTVQTLVGVIPLAGQTLLTSKSGTRVCLAIDSDVLILHHFKVSAISHSMP